MTRDEEEEDIDSLIPPRISVHHHVAPFLQQHHPQQCCSRQAHFASSALHMDLDDASQTFQFTQFVHETIMLVAALDCAALSEFRVRHPSLHVDDVLAVAIASSKNRQVCMPDSDDYNRFADGLAVHEPLLDRITGARSGWRAKAVMRMIVADIAKALHENKFVILKEGDHFISTWS